MRTALSLVLAGLVVHTLAIPSAAGNATSLASWTPESVWLSLIPGSAQGVEVVLSVDRPVENPELVVRGPLEHRTLVVPLHSPLTPGDHPVGLTVWAEAGDRVGRAVPGLVQLFDGRRPVAAPLMVRLEVADPPPAEAVEGLVEPSPDLVTESQSGPPFVAGELVVFPAAGSGLDDMAAVAAEWSGELVGKGHHAGMYQLRFPDVTNEDDLLNRADELQSDPRVSSAAFHALHSPGFVPNDPLHAEDSAWSVKAKSGLALTEVWDPDGIYSQTGDPGVTVAIIDNHFAPSHEDLRANAVLEFSRPPSADHGTSVASAAAAEGNNGLGMTGAMWAADLRLWEVQTLVPDDPTTPEDEGSDLDAALTCDWMVLAAASGAEVVNYSAGSQYTSVQRFNDDRDWWSDCIEDAILGAAGHKGAESPIFVFAAGNDASDASMHLPAALAEDPVVGASVMSIGAHDSTWALSDWGIDRDGNPSGSNWGDHVSVLAPGTAVNCAKPNDDYSACNGTSFAAPLVAGLAGLTESHVRRECGTDPSGADVKQIIVDGSRHYGLSLLADGHRMWFAHAPETLDVADHYCANIVEHSTGYGTQVPVLGSHQPMYMPAGEPFFVRHALWFQNYCLGPVPSGLDHPGIIWELRLDGVLIGETSQVGCYAVGQGEDGYPSPILVNGALWQFASGDAGWPLSGTHTLAMRLRIPGEVLDGVPFDETWTRTIVFTP